MAAPKTEPSAGPSIQPHHSTMTDDEFCAELQRVAQINWTYYAFGAASLHLEAARRLTCRSLAVGEKP